MYTFPLAWAKQTWIGQGTLIGGLIPYFGGNSLGICYGLSAVWIQNGTPVDMDALMGEKFGDVVAAQETLSQSMGLSEQQVLEFTAQDIELDVTATQPFNPPSHLILELLRNDMTDHYLIGFFYYTAAGPREGHAIAVSFDSPTSGTIFDPNWGLAHYNSRTLLCQDLHGLLASYVAGGGHVESSYLQTIRNDDAFLGFVSSSTTTR